MIDEQNLFDQAVNNYLRTYDNIRKIATGQEHDFTTGYLLDCKHFKEPYKMIATDLSKLQAPRAYRKAIH